MSVGEPLVLAQLHHRLAGRVAVAEARRLQPPVVQRAAEAQHPLHLAGQRHPGPAQHRGSQAGPPRGQDRSERLAQQAGDLRQRQHAVGRGVEDPVDVEAHRVLERVGDVLVVDELTTRVEAEDRRDRRQVEQPRGRRLPARAQAVGEPQDGHDRVGIAVAEVLDGRLGLDDVLLQARARRVRAAHRLGEERGVVLLDAVVVRAGLEDELADACACGEHVHGPDDVVLVGEPRRGDRAVDDQPGVDDGVDLGRLDDPADERVRVGDLDELGAQQLDLRRAPVDADDRLDLGVALERLGDPAAPVGRQAGDQDPLRRRGAHPNHTLLRSPSMSKSSSWIVARMSWATVWTRLLSSHGSSPMSSVRTGGRKRILNFAGR